MVPGGDAGALELENLPAAKTDVSGEVHVGEACPTPAPSAWPVRTERRHRAAQRAMAALELRITAMEEHAYKPHVSMDEHQNFGLRLQLLEKIYVLMDLEHVSQSLWS